MMHLTRNRIQQLHQEHLQLREKLQVLTRELEELRGTGKFRKNVDLHCKMEELELAQLRLDKIDWIISNSRVITEVDASTASIGTIVTVQFSDAQGPERYLIAGEEERPPRRDISVIAPESRLAQCILGASVGEVIALDTGRGLHLQVLAIKPMPGLSRSDKALPPTPHRTAT